MKNIAWMLKALYMSGTIMFTACAVQSPDRYYWGSYEAILLNMYKNPSEETPGVQISKIIIDIEKAENRGKPIPPGVYAHLGFMYAANGNLDKAMEAFNAEKTIFPEAKTFIEGIEKRAVGNFGQPKEQ